MEINSKGFWENPTNKGHHHDPNLAKAIVMLLYRLNLTSVLDLGCGMGEYSRILQLNKFYVEAYDGNPHTPQLTQGLGKVIDLSKYIDFDEGFDCVMSLEVGEHIPEEFEQTFLDNICRHCYYDGLIILSWAIPGQPGDGHVNCKPNSYIIDQMAARDWQYSQRLSKQLRLAAHLPWFKNTLMVFQK